MVEIKKRKEQEAMGPGFAASEGYTTWVCLLSGENNFINYNFKFRYMSLDRAMQERNLKHKLQYLQAKSACDT